MQQYHYIINPINVYAFMARSTEFQNFGCLDYAMIANAAGGGSSAAMFIVICVCFLLLVYMIVQVYHKGTNIWRDDHFCSLYGKVLNCVIQFL